MGTAKFLSFEEFEQLPDEPGTVELLDGELIQVPPAKYKHAEIVRRIHALLLHFVTNAETPANLANVYSQIGYKFNSRTWLQPDVSIPHRYQLREDYLESGPALAVEVISELTMESQLDRKRRVYLTNGTVELWLVYPDTRTVWVYREGHAEEFQTVLRTQLLPGLEIDLAQLFD